MSIGYTIRKAFDPSHGRKWSNYIDWIGLHQVTDIIGLDCSLSPCPIDEHRDDDWDSLIEIGHLWACYKSPVSLHSAVLDRVDLQGHHILAVTRNPSDPCIDHKEWLFAGYELIEEQTAISALTNCDGFEEALNRSRLNAHGPISTLVEAKQIKSDLCSLYPDEPHADTELWAIWDLQTTAQQDARLVALARATQL